MPAISNFFGITIRMQSEKGGKHHKPHIHAIYGDCEIVMALDCETLEVFFKKTINTSQSIGFHTRR